MTIDWSKYGTVGGGGGAINWQQHGTAPLIKSDQPSSGGGGGFWGSIGGFLGGHGPLGAVESTIGNLGGDLADMIHGTPGAAIGLGEAGLNLFRAPGFSAGGGGSLGFHVGPSKGQTIQKLLAQTEQQYKYQYGPLAHGDFGEFGHRFAQHPLGPILDIATVASLGGGGALRLARLGALGERATALANEPRLLKVGEHAESLTASKTLQGRIRQAAFDRYSESHPDMPIIGANHRMSIILNRRAAVSMLRARVPVRQFQRITQQLTPDEKFAYHVAAEGVPLDERVAFYRSQIAERPTRILRKYLKNLERPGVATALHEPRPQFIEALHQGKALEEAAGQRLMDTGQLSPEARAERAAMPQEMMRSAAPETGLNPIHPDLPEPFRFWHAGGKASISRQFTAPKTEGMLGKAATLGQTKHSLGVRVRQAAFETDPERVLSTDYLSTMRHELIVDMQKEALDPISKPLSGDLVDTGFKQEGEYYYRPSFDRKTTTPVPRHVREQEALARDRAPLEQQASRDDVRQASKGIVSQDIRDLGLDQADLHNLDRLNELGVRRVPAAFGKSFEREFAGTHWAVRYFLDRPLDVWRAITLNFRPAWAVNNLVGNTLMGLAAHPGSALSYLRTLRLERGDDKVVQLWKWTKTRPTLRRKYAPVFQEVAPELHSAGLFGTQTKVTHLGSQEGRLAGLAANPAIKVLGFAPKIVGRGVMSIGRGVTKLEVVFAEDTGREAIFMRSVGADIAKIRATAKKMGEANLSYADALRRLDRPAVERGVRAVHDAVGDFNDLSPFERSVVRRAIPFYSWFKVITKVSAKYAARYPARLKMLQAIEQAQDKKGEPALPSWLTGAILIGKPSKGVQALVSTQGINPYETIPQIASGGAGSVLNPFATAGVVGLTGRNPAFGNLEDYYGLGATNRSGWSGQLERGFGSLASGLAPARLYSQTTEPYQGKLYAPKTYHAGPVPISDFWLQYFGIPLRHVRLAEAKRERGL